MGIYRGLAPLKAYKGDMQPVNVYKGSTKVAGWHSASYSGTSPLAVDCDYDVPPDALTVDGKCSQVQSCWGTNLVTNGDFSNGKTGWTYAKCGTPIIINNTCSFTATAQFGCIQCAFSIVAGHIYYISGFVKAASMRAIGFHSGAAWIGNMGSKDFSNFQHLSYTTVATITSNSAFIQLNDPSASGWTQTQCKYFAVVDLTAAFGAGHEPTAAQMDAIMAQFPNSWFDGSAQLSTDITMYTPNSPSPSFPAPISTITGNVGITGADGAASDTATVAFGSDVCASLPDGTHDTYDAVTGVLSKRVGKFIGSSGTSWTISDAATSASFMSDRISAGTMSAQTVTASAACAPTVYYKLATPTTVQLVPHLPVVRTGIKTLSVGADVVPTLSATVKSMD